MRSATCATGYEKRLPSRTTVSNTLTHYLAGGTVELEPDRMRRHFFLGDRRVAMDAVDLPVPLTGSLWKAAPSPLTGRPRDDGGEFSAAPAPTVRQLRSRHFVAHRFVVSDSAAAARVAATWATIVLVLVGVRVLVAADGLRGRTAGLTAVLLVAPALPLSGSPGGFALLPLPGAGTAEASTPGEFWFFHTDMRSALGRFRLGMAKACGDDEKCTEGGEGDGENDEGRSNAMQGLCADAWREWRRPIPSVRNVELWPCSSARGTPIGDSPPHRCWMRFRQPWSVKEWLARI